MSTLGKKEIHQRALQAPEGLQEKGRVCWGMRAEVEEDASSLNSMDCLAAPHLEWRNSYPAILLCILLGWTQNPSKRCGEPSRPCGCSWSCTAVGEATRSIICNFQEGGRRRKEEGGDGEGQEGQGGRRRRKEERNREKNRERTTSVSNTRELIG